MMEDWKLGPTTKCKVIMEKKETEILGRTSISTDEGKGVKDESYDSDSYLRSRSRVLIEELNEVFAKCEKKCRLCDKYMGKLYEHFKQTHGHEQGTTDSGIHNDDESESTQGSTTDILVEEIKLDPDEIDIEFEWNSEEKEEDPLSMSMLDVILPETSIVSCEIPENPQEITQRQTPHTREKRKRTSNRKFLPEKSTNEQRDSTFSVKERKKVVQKKQVLRVGLKKHTGEKEIYSCQVCDKHFTCSDYLRRHEKIHTGNKPHSCKDCGKRFSSKTRLRNHVRIHTGEKPYTCQYCDVKFRDKTALNRHTRIHTGKTLRPCEICGKEFKEKNSLHYHAKSHTGERPFTCESCGIGLKTIYLLERHTRTHTGEKPYLCQTCGKGFLDSSTLNQHVNIHTGEKLHPCESCGKGFNDLSNLRRHRLTHTGEKRFVCETCGKDFTGQQALTHHTRIHTGEKPYGCEYCGKRFSIKTVFNKHSCAHEVNSE